VSGGIHHVCIFLREQDGRDAKWDSTVTQITEAYERRRRKEPVVSRILPEAAEAKFLFSLMRNDTIEARDETGVHILRIKRFNGSKQIWFVPVNDAHSDDQQTKFRIMASKMPNSLKELRPRKVIVDLLGDVLPVNE
jgi:hypothetical protein